MSRIRMILPAALLSLLALTGCGVADRGAPADAPLQPLTHVRVIEVNGSSDLLAGCDGSTMIYKVERGIAAVANDPRCTP